MTQLKQKHPKAASAVGKAVAEAPKINLMSGSRCVGFNFLSSGNQSGLPRVIEDEFRQAASPFDESLPIEVTNSSRFSYSECSIKHDTLAALSPYEVILAVANVITEVASRQASLRAFVANRILPDSDKEVKFLEDAVSRQIDNPSTKYSAYATSYRLLLNGLYMLRSYQSELDTKICYAFHMNGYTEEADRGTTQYTEVHAELVRNASRLLDDLSRMCANLRLSGVISEACFEAMRDGFAFFDQQDSQDEGESPEYDIPMSVSRARMGHVFTALYFSMQVYAELRFVLEDDMQSNPDSMLQEAVPSVEYFTSCKELN